LVIDASVYMVGPEDLALAEVNELEDGTVRCNKPMVEVTITPGIRFRCQPEHVLCQGDYVRYEGFKILAMRQGLCDQRCEQWKIGLGIVNVTQAVTFIDTVNKQTMPALLRNSRLVDLVSNTMIQTSEHWVIMGFPHPSFDIPRSASKYFPLSNLVADDSAGRVSCPDQRRLAGNAMHWLQASSLVLHTWASTIKRLNSH